MKVDRERESVVARHTKKGAKNTISTRDVIPALRGQGGGAHKVKVNVAATCYVAISCLVAPPQPPREEDASRRATPPTTVVAFLPKCRSNAAEM